MEYDTAMVADAAITPSPAVKSPRLVPAKAAVEVVDVGQETQAEDDTGNLSMSSTETESDGEDAPSPAAQRSVPYCRMGVPRPPPKPRKHEVSFSPGPNKRDVRTHCGRALYAKLFMMWLLMIISCECLAFLRPLGG